jgi:hypothetical protein
MLLGRMLDDASRVFQLELRLLEVRMSSAMTVAADRAMGALAMIFAGAIGSICLLAAFIIWLHKSFESWQSLALGGAAALLVAIALCVAMKLMIPHNQSVSGT